MPYSGIIEPSIGQTVKIAGFPFIVQGKHKCGFPCFGCLSRIILRLAAPERPRDCFSHCLNSGVKIEGATRVVINKVGEV